MRAFKLDGNRYAELSLMDERLWLDEVQLGLGVWVGRYRGAEGKWLRWYDHSNTWIPTEAEQVMQQATRAEQAAARADRLAEHLRSLGIDPNLV